MINDNNKILNVAGEVIRQIIILTTLLKAIDYLKSLVDRYFKTKTATESSATSVSKED